VKISLKTFEIRSLSLKNKGC